VAERSYVGGGADTGMATAVYATAMMQMGEADITQGRRLCAGRERGWTFAMWKGRRRSGRRTRDGCGMYAYVPFCGQRARTNRQMERQSGLVPWLCPLDVGEAKEEENPRTFIYQNTERTWPGGTE
jgi:hypothetical protein